MNFKREKKYNTPVGKWIWSFILAAAIIVLYKSFDRLSDVFGWLSYLVSILTPIIWAGVIGYFLSRPAGVVEKLLKKAKKPAFIAKHARGLSVLIIYPLFIGLLILIVGLMIPALLDSLVILFGNFKGYFTTAAAWLETTAEQYHIVDDLNIMTTLLNWFKSIVEKIDIDTITTYAGSIVSVGETISSFIVTLIIAVYILLDRENILKVLKRILSMFLKPKPLEQACRYVRRCDKVVYKYFVGQLADCFIVVLMASIGLAIIGVDNWFLFGFIFGMFNLIPTFGPIIAGVAVVFIILMANGFQTALISAIVLLALQQIDANILNPRILGESLDMSPFWVMVSISVGGGLFGFVGMLIGVPVIAIIRLVYRDILVYQKNKRKREAMLTQAEEATEMSVDKSEVSSDE